MNPSPLDKYPLRFTVGGGVPTLEAWAAWNRASGNPSWPATWRASGIIPRFFAGASALARISGVDWAITSDFRNSPSHKKGGAIDLAPVIEPWAAYSLASGLDPVLNCRPAVLNHVQLAAAVASKTPSPRAHIVWCVEDDHVHAHILEGAGIDQLYRVPWRTHPHYRSHPNDDACRVDPSNFRPRY